MEERHQRLAAARVERMDVEGGEFFQGQGKLAVEADQGLPGLLGGNQRLPIRPTRCASSSAIRRRAACKSSVYSRSERTMEDR